ncbi:hypothetical protein ROJ8625_01148 [Roseivivax jejudonensis]|uniref:Uncharacterized protein n=1 Tax=Roseivivax jejudonensis TaxID=1529041 RepID=A0A1X6YQ02_9RHOB|nr:hypothetical protein [Roseivivax jejudonensis]SLN27728.1 hypothetical protein ROJ8625_01148 [Roseivivax jejudonensis]
MRYSIRKQTRQDFDARVRRLDPHYARTGQSSGAAKSRNRSPLVWSVFGFVWIYVTASVARNQAFLRDSLAQGNLSSDAQYAVMAGLGAMLAISAVMVLWHLSRVLVRRRERRGASTPILCGGALALALCYTPPSVLENGLQMLDPNTSKLLRTAQNTVSDGMGIDLGSVSFTSLN